MKALIGLKSRKVFRCFDAASGPAKYSLFFDSSVKARIRNYILCVVTIFNTFSLGWLIMLGVFENTYSVSALFVYNLFSGALGAREDART